jgi:hypothetical protein
VSSLCWSIRARADLAEQRLGDLKAMLDDMRRQRDDAERQRDKWETVATRLSLSAPKPDEKPPATPIPDTPPPGSPAARVALDAGEGVRARQH